MAGLTTIFNQGGPLTYTYTGTGGITVAGSAAVQAGHAYIGVGGFTFGGVAAWLKEKAYSGSGGIVVSGVADVQSGHQYLGAGGMVFGGQAQVQLGHVYLGAGGIVLGGEALIEAGLGAVEVSGSGGPEYLGDRRRGVRRGSAWRSEQPELAAEVDALISGPGQALPVVLPPDKDGSPLPGAPIPAPLIDAEQWARITRLSEQSARGLEDIERIVRQSERIPTEMKNAMLAEMREHAEFQEAVALILTLATTED